MGAANGGPRAARSARPVVELVPSSPGSADLAPAAELLEVSKAFGPTQALADVSITVRPGEVLALVGENGAGKSTCAKLLGGVYRPDAGSVYLAGEQVTLHGPLDAQRRGVAVVNQHPGLFGDLTIAENVFVGRPPRTRAGLLDHPRMRRDAAIHLARIGLHRSPSTLVNGLRTSEQQLVEIARALAADARVVVLDEPTAALSRNEVNRLFRVVDELRRDGVAVVFVGHRLEEIFEIADRVSVLRDGRHAATRRTTDTSEAEIVRLMVGRALTDLYPPRAVSLGPVMLSVDGLCSPSGLRDVTLAVRAGEIVGLAGLVGSGRTELARVLFGIDRKSAGRIVLDGAEVDIRSAGSALSRGIAYVSEDRRGQSLVEEFSILENATLPVIGRATRARLVVRRLQLALVASPLQRMSLRYQSYAQPVNTLSGGNQQKVVLAKWLATNPRLLILDEPTQGVDVAAKAEVHHIIADLAAQGLAILLISSDLPEVLGMSDRILVMRRGRIVDEFTHDEATQEAIGASATGAYRAEWAEPRPAPTPAPSDRRPVAAAAGSAMREPAGRGSSLRIIAARREVGLVAALIAMIIPISLINPRFLSATNLSSVSAEASLVGLVAAGELMVVLTRNIDVSIGSVVGLTAFMFGSFVKLHPHAPVMLAVIVAAATGLACGVVNGLIISYGKVPSIVATLGTLYVYRGIDSIVSDGKEIAPGDIPLSVQRLASAKTLGLAGSVWICLAVFVAAGIALRWTTRGRELYQVGSNPEAAALVGVRIDRRILSAFAVSGLLAGVTGALWAAHYGIVDGQSASGHELTVIAAVVVGGAALRGGYGTVLGAALGTVALFTIQNVFELAKVDADYLQALYGAAILTAVSVDMLIARRTRRPAVI